MEPNPDRLSANRICVLTGVNPQTRDTWVGRELLRDADDYGELDVIEQTVVKAMLAALPKGDVDLVWREVRPYLRHTLVSAAVALVWDREGRRVEIAEDDAALRAAVCHGHALHALPLGELVAEARRIYRAEVEVRRAAAEAKRRRAGGKPRRQRSR
jgi:uncharacterized protein YheU (UPF0270 family)